MCNIGLSFALCSSSPIPTTTTHTHTHAGGNNEIGQLIADAMAKVGRQGVVTMEESKTADDNLVFVEGMQFDRGYYSPYFVTDPERMVCEYENCRCVWAVYVYRRVLVLGWVREKSCVQTEQHCSMASLACWRQPCYPDSQT